ncbi:molecular chaperone DnaJ [Candidatus Oleimmundimicrobium sp.]|uniref:molecular chaperone DnaJ n=1 Tax=Candidatus Oleimmundimicrobium sp. TaxID=3060597 RepID=UPI00271E56B1|nr:molecular chaperone DnaJ [Candidatus Oleimmundimicrobium sp.]MDO8885850.1 molecular chaperone DnaJ [Candidatus Oleimmundimicrobium sp.]
MGKKDYYDILGVSRNATEKEIKKMYRDLARKYHPDVNSVDVDAEEKFKEIVEAYEILSNSEKRYQYDNSGHAKTGAAGFGGFGGFEDLFGMVFGDFGFQSETRPTRERGSDLIYEVAIELEEAQRGVKKVINIKKAVTCKKCNGTGAEYGTSVEVCPSCGGSGFIRSTQRSLFGNLVKTHTCKECGGRGGIITSPCSACGGEGRVNENCNISIEIPAGVPSGSRLKIRGQGEAGFRGGLIGNLYINVYVKPHNYFEVNNYDVICDYAISFSQAALGATIEVLTLGGNEKLKLPPGVQSGTIFCLKGKGLPYLNNRKSGDQFVRINVATPTKLSAARKKLLKDMAEFKDKGLGMKKRVS